MRRTQMARFRISTAWIVGFAAACWCATATRAETKILAPGNWKLEKDGSLYSLRANEAKVSEVVSSIDAMIPSDFRIRNVPESTVSGTFHRLSLSDLLDKLEVNYVLHYQTIDEPDHVVLQRVSIGIDDAPGTSRAHLQRIRELIENLRDDDIRFNAVDSLAELRNDAEAIPALEQALQNRDYQTRQYAAEALGHLVWNENRPYKPSLRFLETLVEGMRDDSIPFGGPYVEFMNAENSYRYFTTNRKEVDRAEAALVGAMHGPDPQQRLLSAVVLARAGKTNHVNRLTQILLPHLASNELSGDAGLAAKALYKLGPAAWPYLEPLPEGEDLQQTTLAKHILALGLDPDAKPDRDLLRSLGFGRDPLGGRIYREWAPERFPRHD